MFLSDVGGEIPDSLYSSGWYSLQNSQNTHGFYSLPNSSFKDFTSSKNQDSTKLFFDTSTQTNFNTQNLIISNKNSNISKTSDLDILNGPTSTRMPWPAQDTVLKDFSEQKIDPIEDENLLEDPKFSYNNFELPEFNTVTGMVAGTLNNSIMSGLNQQNYTKVMQGNGPNQGDFNSQRTAQLTLDNRNIASSVGSTIMSASSLLGPEAFAAGTVIGAGIDIATEMGAFDSPQAQVNTN